MRERAEELVDDPGVVRGAELWGREEHGVQGEVRRPRELLSQRRLAVSAVGVGRGVRVDPRRGFAHDLRRPLAGVQQQVGSRERRGRRRGRIAGGGRRAAVARVREGRDEEVQPER